MNKELICIVCPKGCRLTVSGEDELSVSGNSCPRGIAYGIKEVTAPTRVITSTVKIEGATHNRLPVKTSGDIPKMLIKDCMELINSISVQAPIQMNTVLMEDIFNTGIHIVATRDLYLKEK